MGHSARAAVRADVLDLDRGVRGGLAREHDAAARLIDERESGLKFRDRLDAAPQPVGCELDYRIPVLDDLAFCQIAHPVMWHFRSDDGDVARIEGSHLVADDEAAAAAADEVDLDLGVVVPPSDIARIVVLDPPERLPINSAPARLGVDVPIPSSISEALPAVTAIRNAYEHIEDRAMGTRLGVPHPTAAAVFDYSRLLDEDVIAHGGDTFNVARQADTVIAACRATLKSMVMNADRSGHRSLSETAGWPVCNRRIAGPRASHRRCPAGLPRGVRWIRAPIP